MIDWLIDWLIDKVRNKCKESPLLKDHNTIRPTIRQIKFQQQQQNILDQTTIIVGRYIQKVYSESIFRKPESLKSLLLITRKKTTSILSTTIHPNLEFWSEAKRSEAEERHLANFIFFLSVCSSVCSSVCLFVCLSVRAKFFSLTFFDTDQFSYWYLEVFIFYKMFLTINLKQMTNFKKKIFNI